MPLQLLVAARADSGIAEMFVGGGDPSQASPVGTATPSRRKPS